MSERTEPAKPNDPATGAQMWRLNLLGLLANALIKTQEQAREEGVKETDIGRVVLSKGVANDVLAEAKEAGLW